MYRHPLNLGWIWLLASFALASLTLPTQAQVVPDATLGPGRNSVTNTQGTRTDITGGLRRSSALFHSFDRFSIDTNRQVYFANPTGIRNIFSRVTGSSVSNIDGLLGVSGSANLFFMNPNGIIFGPNARLDVAGSFLATTANVLEFADGQRFAADGDRAVPLVEVNIPIGLQIGANAPAMLTSRGNLATGQDLTLAAGNLDLQGQVQAGGNLTLQASDTVKIRDTVTEPFVAQAGDKLLIQSNQKVDIFALNHPISSLISAGDMVLRSANPVIGDAHYWTGGSFQIEKMDGHLGNLFSPYDPVIRAAGDVSFASYNGNSLHIFAGGKVTIPGNITIQDQDGINGIDQNVSLTLPLPTGGTLTEVVPIRGRSQPTLDIRAGTLAVGAPGLTPSPIPGATGPITLSAASGSDIAIGSITNINFDARIFLTNQFQPRLALNNGAIRITNSIVPPGLSERFSIAAYGVPVTLAARGDVQVASGIVTGSQDIPGGDIRIFSGGNIDVSGGRLFSQTTDSNSGNIRLEALGGIATGVIDTKVLGATVNVGNAGDVRLAAGGNITTNNNNIISRVEDGATGTGGDINIISQNNSITNLGNIESSTANGSGGLITIRANGDIQANNNDIKSQVGTGGAGQGGDINIISLNGAVRNLGIVESSTPQGDGGNVAIIANRGGIDAGAIRAFVGTIDTVAAEATGGPGRAGNITLNASGGINVSGRTQSFTGTGDGGSISFTANDTINAGALRSFVGTISTNQIETTGGTGAAGTITLQSNTGAINVSSDISAFSGTDTVSAANPGNVKLEARNDIRTQTIRTFVGNSDSVGKVTGGTATSGSIILRSIDLSSTQGGVDTTQGTLISAGPTRGANITLTAEQNIKTANVISQATNQTDIAQAGNITFTSSSGTIDTSRGTLNSEGVYDGGFIALIAKGDITTAAISSLSSGNLGFGGAITLTSSIGGINTLAGELKSEGFQLGREIKLDAAQKIVTANITSRSTAGNGGSLVLASQNSGIDTSQGILNSEGAGSGGKVTLAAKQTIDAGNISSTSKGTSFSSGTGGEISITSEVGGVNVSNRFVNSSASGNADGGNIRIDANGSVNITNSSITAETSGGSSGSITVQSHGNNLTFAGGVLRTTVNAGAIDSGGGITIASNGGQIEFSNGFQVNSATNTQAALGRGGDVAINSSGGKIIFNGNSAIDASTSGTQIGGNVSVASGNQNLELNSGSISTTVKPNASANGGSIALTTNGGAINLGNATANTAFTINAQTQATNLTGTSQENGRGGNVTVSSSGGAIAIVAASQVNAGTTGTKDGGTIAINSGSGTTTLSNRATVNASTSGTGNANDVNLDAANLRLENSTILSQGESLTGSAASGNITLSGLTTLQLDNSKISASTVNGAAGRLFVNAGGTPLSAITLDRSQLSLAATGNGSAGDIQLNTQQLILQSNSTVSAEAAGTGSAGSVRVDANGSPADTISLTGGSSLLTRATGSGNAGSIALATRQLTLTDESQISGSTAGGQGENIDLTGLNRLQVTNSLISASTTGDNGRAGNVMVDATDSVSLSGTFKDASGGISTRAANGKGSAGQVVLSTPQLIVQNGAAIVASTDSGTGNNIILSGVNTLQVSNNSNISASTQSGVAGNVILNTTASPAATVVLNNGSVAARADKAAGRAGSVTLNARSIYLQNNSSIEASNIDAPFRIGVGDITLAGLDILNVSNSQIAASTSSGVAGNLSISATGNVDLQNSSLSVEATNGGTAGNLTVQADRLRVTQSEITVSSPTGSAGNLTLTTPDLRLDRGTLSAATGGNGTGANITIQGLQTPLFLRNGSLISANAGEGANGGNINISAPYIIGQTFENSDIVANAVRGSGGRINITTNAIFGLQFRPKLTPLSDITASSDFGTSGVVALNTLNIDPARGLTQLPTDLVDRTSQISQGCSVGSSEKESQFKIAGRGGIQLSPTALLPAQVSTSDWVGLEGPAIATSSSEPRFPDGSLLGLKPGQTYQVRTVCVNSWRQQQRSSL